MAKKTGSKGKGMVKTLDDLEHAANNAAEVEVESNSDQDLHFEGGELDGTSTTVNEFEREHGSEDDSAEEKAPKKKTKQKTPDQAEAAPAAEAESEEADEQEEQEEEEVETPADDSDAGEPKEEEEEEETEEEPAAYQPTSLKYKVYDQEKEFPDWVKPLVSSKEHEENLRTVLQKSDAFDVLKPKHEETRGQKEFYERVTSDHVRKIERLAKLKETDPDQFFTELGVTDDELINHAIKIHQAKSNPDLKDAFEENRRIRRENYAREAATMESSNQGQSDLQSIHRTNVETVMAMPTVSDFKARMDAAMGPGSFDREFRNTGSELIQSNRGAYVHPSVVTQQVMERYGKLLPQGTVIPAGQGQPAAQQQQAAAPGAANGSPAPAPVVKKRPQTLPNVGRGTAASPIKKPLKNLDDLKNRVNKELSR